MLKQHTEKFSCNLDAMGNIPVSNLWFPCGKYIFLFKHMMFNCTPVNVPLKHSNCAILVAILKVGGCDSPSSEQSPEQSYQH